MFSTVCANCSSAGLMMKPMPKNCNRNCLDHKEHVISRSHTPLDVKPKANCWKKQNVFKSCGCRVGRAPRKLQIICKVLLPTRGVLTGFTILLFSAPMRGRTRQRLLLLATSLLHSHAKASGFASQGAAALGAMKALAAPVLGELLKSSIWSMQTDVAVAPKKGRLLLSWQMFFKALQQGCKRLREAARLNPTQHTGCALLWQHSLSHPETQ